MSAKANSKKKEKEPVHRAQRNLSILRSIRGLNRTEMANKLDMDKTTYGRLEDETMLVRLSVLEKAAKILGRPITWLFTYEPDEDEDLAIVRDGSAELKRIPTEQHVTTIGRFHDLHEQLIQAESILSNQSLHVRTLSNEYESMKAQKEKLERDLIQQRALIAELEKKLSKTK